MPDQQASAPVRAEIDDRAVYLVAGKRTPFGKLGGAFRSLAAWELGAAAIRAALEGIPGELVDRVILANVTNQGNVARLSALAAGVPADRSAVTVNAQCAGGMTAVRVGIEAIRAGAASVVVAGGAESVSNAAVSLGERGVRAGQDGRMRVSHAPPPFADPEMGEAADALALQLGISREEQDAWALESHRRARVVANAVMGTICEIETESGTVTADELGRRPVSASLMARLRPAFSEGGTVTAGNAALVADGAAAVVLARGSVVREWNLRPLARIVSAIGVAGDPALPPLAAIAAAEGALAAAGLSAGEMALWEVNEAFAAKAIAFGRHFALEAESVNVGGGALTWGHPFAASGAAVLLQLGAHLQPRDGALGLAAIAGAGGTGEAIILASIPHP